MKKNKNISKYLICISLILICSLIFIEKTFENDLFFDIKTGQNILKYGIDFKDHFSFIPNLVYIYHHWLYDLIVYGIYKLFDYTGIFSLFLIVYSTFGLVVFYINRKTANTFISLFVSIYTLCTASIGFLSRVQSLTYILFFLEIYLIEKLYKNGEKKYSIALIINSILIVNLHIPIWIFYIILYLPYITETLLYLLSQKKESLKNLLNIEKPASSKIILITFLILLFTGLICPLKFNAYTFFTKSLFNNSYLIISEMNKTILYYFKAEIIIILAFIIGMYTKIIKITFRDFLLITGLFIFSLIAKRNVTYIMIIGPTIFIKNINTYYNFTNKKINNLIKRINLDIVSKFTAVVLIGLYIFICYNYLSEKNDYGITDKYPDKMVSYIKENLDYKNIKVYNDFNYGSYMELYDIPVFIDSRAEVYIKEYNGGYDIINDYANSKKYVSYKEIFDKYNFDYALVYSDSELYQCLINDKDYKLVDEEDDLIKYALFKNIKINK